MKTHNVTLTDAELVMVIEGLGAIASDYCTSREEEQPFNALKAKLTPLVTGCCEFHRTGGDESLSCGGDTLALTTVAPVVDQEDDEFVLMERQWKGK